MSALGSEELKKELKLYEDWKHECTAFPDKKEKWQREMDVDAYMDSIEISVRFCEDKGETESKLNIAGVNTRYFLFYGTEDGEKTKYIVDDCETRDEAIIAIENAHPDFKWTATEQFNGC